MGRSIFLEAPLTSRCVSPAVDPAIVELGKGAVKRLRGLRLCPPGVEHHITHLVIEKERRTLKVHVCSLADAHHDLGSPRRHCIRSSPQWLHTAKSCTCGRVGEDERLRGCEYLLGDEDSRAVLCVEHLHRGGLLTPRPVFTALISGPC